MTHTPDFHFDRDLSTDKWSIEIDTAAQYGCIERKADGLGGGLWFEGRTLVDYDGVSELPRSVCDALRAGGFDLGDCE